MNTLVVMLLTAIVVTAGLFCAALLVEKADERRRRRAGLFTRALQQEMAATLDEIQAEYLRWEQDHLWGSGEPKELTGLAAFSAFTGHPEVVVSPLVPPGHVYVINPDLIEFNLSEDARELWRWPEAW